MVAEGKGFANIARDVESMEEMIPKGLEDHD